MFDCHSILEFCVVFSGVKLSIRSFNLFIIINLISTGLFYFVVALEGGHPPSVTFDLDNLEY